MSTLERKFFFVHVMKTAGWTLRRHIAANFEPDEIYPQDGVDPDLVRANLLLARLLELPASRRKRIRVYAGHFPFVAVELLREDVTTMTVLRDPVDRTLSFLRQWQRLNDSSRSIEELYEDPMLFPGFIRDHQAKLFALTAADEPESCVDALEVDRERLDLAKRNLETVDLVATQDRFDELLAEVDRRFGWRRAPITRWNVGTPTPGDAPASFRRRIAEDNARDVEFFEHAQRLAESRGRSQTG